MEHRVSIARLDYPAADIYLYMDSKYAPMRIRSCSREPWTVAWIERWLTAGDVLWDVGANVGAYALVAAKHHEGRVTVVAVEPAHATFSSLCENIVLNDAAEAVIPLDVVLGARTGLGQFNYRDLDPGAGLHSTDDRPFLKGAFEPVYRQPTLTYRLDDLLSYFPIPAPNHLKIDVDGAEVSVLEGATATLSSPGLRTVMIEVNVEGADRLTGLLGESGLTLIERYEPLSTHGHWYGLFSRESPRG